MSIGRTTEAVLLPYSIDYSERCLEKHLNTHSKCAPWEFRVAHMMNPIVQFSLKKIPRSRTQLNSIDHSIQLYLMLKFISTHKTTELAIPLLPNVRAQQIHQLNVLHGILGLKRLKIRADPNCFSNKEPNDTLMGKPFDVKRLMRLAIQLPGHCWMLNVSLIEKNVLEKEIISRNRNVAQLFQLRFYHRQYHLVII